MFRTLSARLFAVLMVGLGTIQIVSFFAFMVFRGEEIKEQMMRFLGADVSFAYDLMRSVPPEQRPDDVAAGRAQLKDLETREASDLVL